MIRSKTTGFRPCRLAPFIRLGRFVALSLFLSTAGAAAGEVEVVDAQATQGGDGSWTFRVTLLHADTGWDHYADAWDVLTPDGEVVGTRVLLHPHVDEQPFTRSLSGVVIPEGITEVIVRGHDSVHGHGAVTKTVKLTP